MAIKAVILIAGPNKGHRFRPLSFDSPKYAFPVGGQPIIEHLIEACLQLDELTDIILLGFYQPDETLSSKNLEKCVQSHLTESANRSGDGTIRHVSIRYLQEFTQMGTAGGLYHFRDQLRRGDPEAVLVINGDVCGDFDFQDMLEHHRNITERAISNKTNLPVITIMTTEAGRTESQNYGCLVEDPTTFVVNHYVEKPSTFVSNLINCGAYICSRGLFGLLEQVLANKRQAQSNYPIIDHQQGNMAPHEDYLSLELDVLQERTTQPFCFSYRTKGDWWCQIKTAASAIYANRHYLRLNSRKANNLVRQTQSKSGFQVIGDVYIHNTAKIDSSAVIGPNVSIMENVVIGPGVRARESIILQNAVISGHTLIMYSIIGWNCYIGSWVRVEGTPSEPNPNQRFAKVQNPPLFNSDGKLSPSITVLGSNVHIPSGAVILNSIVLPHKQLSRSYKNEIIL